MEGNPFPKVLNVYPGSAAEKGGLMPGDEVMALNGFVLKNNLAEWSNYFGGEKVVLSVNRKGKMHTVSMEKGPEEYFPVYSVSKTGNPAEAQKKNFIAWSKRSW